MPVTLSTPEVLVNTGLIGGPQINAKTVAIAGGGFAVAWQEGPNGQTHMQRYDAFGNAVGSVINFFLSGTLQDVAVANDGRIVVATSFSNVLNVRSVDPATGAVSAGSALSLAATVTGAQLVNTGAANLGLVVNLANNSLLSGTSTSLGVATTVPGSFATPTSSPIIETVATGGANLFSLQENGTILSTDGTSLTNANLTEARDLMFVESGFFLAVCHIVSTQTIALVALTGTNDNLSSYTVGPKVVATSLSGTPGVNELAAARDVVSLGNGRILIVWATHDDFGTAPDGLLAQVYNMATGAAEGAAVNLHQTFNATEIAAADVSATLLADGRVAVSYTLGSGVSDLDVFQRILDPRIAGVTVAGTSAADTFVGSAFDDSFSSVSAADRISGGAGSDTVTLVNLTAASIDLANPAAFVGLGPTLDGIENLVGTASADTFFGNSAGNLLDGANGDDFLAGCAGLDSLLGGAGFDTMQGGQDNDTLRGGADSDRVLGQDGDDQLFGDAGTDTLRGGAGDDFVSGGDGDDVVSGGDGNDTLLGDAGNDTIVTGPGTDLAFGGAGNDTFFVTSADSDLNGGADIDTANYSSLAVGAAVPGIYADLAAANSAIAEEFGFHSAEGLLVGIENLTGSGGIDFLAGNSGGNLIRGGAGADFLMGRGGADTLFGGDGIDTFVFGVSSEGPDLIRDFGPNEDLAFAIGAFGDINGSNIATRFVASATAAPAANGSAQFLFDNAGAGFGQLFFDADGNGAGAAVLVATLQFSTAAAQSGFGASSFLFF